MMHLLVALLLAPGSGPLGGNNVMLRDRLEGPTPVTDKDLRPAKLPDCQTVEQVRRTLAALKTGDAEECFIRDRTAFRSR